MTDQTITPHVDSSPALSPVAAEFTADVPEGVDAASMPDFCDMRRMLPADRLDAQLSLAEVASALPEGMAERMAAGLSIAEFTPEVAAGVRKVFRTMQEIVLDYAADREAMIDWLVSQESPNSALQHAFSQVSAALGN